MTKQQRQLVKIAVVVKTLTTLAILAWACGAHAQALAAQASQQQTTTQSAGVNGVADCRSITLTVTRTVQATGAMQTWVSYTVMECAAGGNAMQVVARSALQVPDSAYVTDRNGSARLAFSDSNGAVSISWTPTSEQRNTYQAVWTWDGGGVASRRETQNDDTRSATATGVLAGKTVDGRQAFVFTSVAVQR